MQEFEKHLLFCYWSDEPFRGGWLKLFGILLEWLPGSDLDLRRLFETCGKKKLIVSSFSLSLSPASNSLVPSSLSPASFHPSQRPHTIHSTRIIIMDYIHLLPHWFCFNRINHVPKKQLEMMPRPHLIPKRRGIRKQSTSGFVNLRGLLPPPSKPETPEASECLISSLNAATCLNSFFFLLLQIHQGKLGVKKQPGSKCNRFTFRVTTVFFFLLLKR